jgi:TPR repeat protein
VMKHIIKTVAYARLLRSALTASLMLAAVAGAVTAVAEPLEFVLDLSGSTQFEKGRTAYGSGDYQTALRLWLPLAAEGDAMAQFYVGVLYANGWGVMRKLPRKRIWPICTILAAAYRKTKLRLLSGIAALPTVANR